MKTPYGDIPKKLCKGVEVSTVRDLKRFLKKLPPDIPIGFNSIFRASVFNTPSAPCVILYDDEDTYNDDGF